MKYALALENGFIYIITRDECGMCVCACVIQKVRSLDNKLPGKSTKFSR